VSWWAAPRHEALQFRIQVLRAWLRQSKYRKERVDGSVSVRLEVLVPRIRSSVPVLTTFFLEELRFGAFSLYRCDLKFKTGNVRNAQEDGKVYR
jgi:hypothetical protein